LFTERELSNINEVHRQIGLNQSEFAAHLYVSPLTLKNCKQE